MKEVKQNMEVLTRVESEDGSLWRYVYGKSEEEIAAAKEDIRKYEESSKMVLFSRLKQRGVLSEIKYAKQTDPNAQLTDEQARNNGMRTLLDCVMDDDMGRCQYYLFTPVNEQDIKDILVYTRMTYDCGIGSSSKNLDYYRTEVELKAGETYIYQVNSDSEWCSFISPKNLASRLAKMCEYYEGLGKTQKKAAK